MSEPKFHVEPFPYRTYGVRTSDKDRAQMVQEVARTLRDNPQEEYELRASGDCVVFGRRLTPGDGGGFEVYSLRNVGHGFSFEEENEKFIAAGRCCHACGRRG